MIGELKKTEKRSNSSLLAPKCTAPDIYLSMLLNRPDITIFKKQLNRALNRTKLFGTAGKR